MRASAYGERDYTFGQAMLTLRTAIGWTQAGLANYLGVSRRAVGEWEVGGSYPKTEHLKEFIALAIKCQAFPTGQEAEEIRLIWKAAHQKTLLDEEWLSALLDRGASSLYLHLVPPPVAPGASSGFTGPDPMEGSVATEQGKIRGQGPPSGDALWFPTGQGQAVAPAVPMVQGEVSTPIVDWSDALAVPVFYGREEESAQLTQWVVQERCHVVCVLGMGGIGKSALSVSTMYQQAEHFDVVIFRSLRDAPSCEALLDDCLQVLSSQSIGQSREGLSLSVGQLQSQESDGAEQGPYSASDRGKPSPYDVERRISLLLSLLRTQRVLVVMDNLESLLEAGDVRGRFRPGFEGYGQLLRRVAETEHQSCLLFTSREKPADLRSLEGKRSPVRSLRLSGLGVTACKRLLVEKDLIGTEADQESLIERYGGNPLALKIVAETILDLFGGEISAFFVEDIGIFGSVTELLDEQFVRLSALEQSMLFWMAIVREPINLDELLTLLVCGASLPGGQGSQATLLRMQVLEVVDSGYRRSLIERGKIAGSFTLQPVVLEYVTAVLIAEGSREIQQRQLNRLIWHGLSQGHAKEYVRQTQERLLLSPLLARLQNAYLEYVDKTTHSSTPVEEQLLDLLDQLRSLPDSAQGYGPANLIALLRLLRGNLNDLDLSSLCIRGAYLQGIEMQRASLAFVQMYDTRFTEAVSPTWGVAISQDGMLWAASGMQGNVCVWGDGGQTLCLIWPAHTNMVQALVFSPNGRTLASGSIDGTVKLWDLEEACSYGTKTPERRTRAEEKGKTSPYGSRGTLLWVGWHNCPQILTFSPDGSLLACSGLGETVRLWDVQSGTVLQDLEHPAHVFAVAWSPDGRFLVSSCFDGQLRFWERQSLSPLPSTEILRFSTSWETSPLWNLAFAPDGRTLAGSGWLDRRIALWEVESGRLLHTFKGETTGRRNSVVWSPDGRLLASCSYEKAIRLWDVEQYRYRATLSGHISDVNGIAFTPDSSILLSTSDDGTLRVWDVQSGQCVHVMHGYAVSHYCLDWSPDGRHLVSCGTDGAVTVWDVDGERPPSELHDHTWFVWRVGWSPDGRWVASCGWDSVIRLWNPISHTCVQTFRNSCTPLTSMAWSPDGSLLAVGTFLQGMCVWNMRESCRLCWVREPGQTVFASVAWSPDGSLLAGGDNEGSVYLWKSADGTRQKRLLGHYGNVMSVAWSPDGKWLASGSANRGNGELFVWDMRKEQVCGDGVQAETQSDSSSPRPVRTFVSHSDMIYAIAWCRVPNDSSGDSSCGDLLITGGGDGKLCWWDIQSGECVSTQNAHRGMVRALTVSPDGTELASCGDDGAIQIWNLASHEHLRTLRRNRPYEQLNITGIKGLTEAQKATLQALGAIETEIGP